MLKENIERVRERISRATARAGRSPEDVQLIAVTKKFPAEVIREAYELGLRQFGENYVQEFEEKAPRLSELAGAHYHLIGRLQSNKARKAAELFQTIQTIDSEKLAARLDSVGKPLDVMIEVKLSAEESKTGIRPEHVPALIAKIRSFPRLRLIGLMTMPPWSEDSEASRPYFARLRELAQQNHLEELSMGMSHDLEVGIEEGATMIRVGTALFGPRKQA